MEEENLEFKIWLSNQIDLMFESEEVMIERFQEYKSKLNDTTIRL